MNKLKQFKNEARPSHAVAGGAVADIYVYNIYTVQSYSGRLELRHGSQVIDLIMKSNGLGALVAFWVP